MPPTCSNVVVFWFRCHFPLCCEQPSILERDDENAEAPPQKSCRTMATQVQQSQSRNEAGNIPELFAKHKPDVCQNAEPILLTLTSLFHLFSSPHLSTSLHKICPLNPFFSHLQKCTPLSFTCVHALLLILFLFFPSPLSDYGVDRSGVWEQRTHQHWWGSQLPEVPPQFLPPEPFIPPHWRGLGLSLQSRPEGEIIVIFFLSSPVISSLLLTCNLLCCSHTIL